MEENQNNNEEEKKDEIIEVEKVEEQANEGAKAEEKANEENNNNDELSNSIKISTDTVATYAGIAISEIAGVYGMSGTFAGLTEAISGKKNYAKGVKVDFTDNKSAKIDVNIIVEYGARIPDVAFEIQTKVKKSVETMTGLKVSAINVNIQGVHAITSSDDTENEK